MIRVNLVQGTLPWLRWRDGGLGGSDAPVVMGVSPYLTAEKLLLEKLGAEHRERNFAMRRGCRLEPQARAAVEKALGMPIAPCCGQDDAEDWLRCSFDGIDFWGEVTVEIKCPNIKEHLATLAGKVPEKYYPQCQHALLVSGTPKLVYASYSQKEGLAEDQQLALVEVRPDANYLTQLIAKEREFWGRVVSGRNRARKAVPA